MSGPRCPKVSSTSNQKICEKIKVPHHSSICNKDQSNKQISLPPLEPHDPIAHELEESYTASTLAQRKWLTSLTFACISQSREYIHSTSARSATHHHGKSRECMSCAFTYFFFVDALKLRVYSYSSLYLSCMLVCVTARFMNHAFTNMG